MELQEIAEYSKVHTVDEIREKFYEDKPIKEVTKEEEDDRGILLPVQIGPSTPAPGKEPPPQLAPFQNGGEQPNEQPGEEMGEEAQEKPQEEEDTEDDKQQEEKKRWERKSLNALKRGKSPAVAFESDHIPAGEHERILAGLAECKTAEDVRKMFAAVPHSHIDDPIVLLAMELKRANDLLEATNKEGAK
jgi:hypothetical protein